MPHVGNDNEPLLSRALYGYNNGVWIPISVSSSGVTEIQSPASQYINSKLYGLINSGWQAQPILLGYSSTLANRNITTSDGSTPTIVQSSTVPSGEIWQITFINAWHDDPTARSCNLYFYDGSQLNEMTIQPSLAQYTSITLSGELTLSIGMNIRFYGNSILSGKAVYLVVGGRKIDIDQ